MVCLAQGTARLTFCPAFPWPPSILLGWHGICPLGPVVSQEAAANWLFLWPLKTLHFLSYCSPEPCLSPVPWPLFICAHLSCMWLLLPPFSVLYFILKIFCALLWPFGALLSTLDLSGTLGVAGQNDAVKCQIKSRWNCMHVWVTSSLFLTSLIQLKQLWKHLIFTFWPLRGA